MTKILEWLFGVTVFLTIWGALVSGQIGGQLAEKWAFLILPLPVMLVVLFGLYAATIILWRVYMFNDCESAAKELQLEIQQAKAELREKGIHFNIDE